MTKIKIGKNEYQIYFAMQPTIQTGIIKKLAALGDIEMSIDNIGSLLETITEVLLVGLQKNHKDEYGFNYVTGDGKDEAMAKAYELMDEYAEDENADYFDLYSKLENELLENGFFAKLFRQEKEKNETEQKK